MSEIGKEQEYLNRMMAPPAAHPADSAEALLRALTKHRDEAADSGIRDHCTGSCVPSIRAALQASAPSPAVAEQPASEAWTDGYTTGWHAAKAEQAAPEPEHMTDAYDRGERAAAEASDELRRWISGNVADPEASNLLRLLAAAEPNADDYNMGYRHGREHERIAAERAAAEGSEPLDVEHGPFGAEGYCQCGYFIGHYDNAQERWTEHLAAYASQTSEGTE